MDLLFGIHLTRSRTFRVEPFEQNNLENLYLRTLLEVLVFSNQGQFIFPGSRSNKAVSRILMGQKNRSAFEGNCVC